MLTTTEYHQYDGGMRLTYATLATFLKYPWLAHAARSGAAPRNDKFSAFDAERALFVEVCTATGMRQLGDHPDACHYARHPLAYLMEAADDFCYAILDLEDGLEMGLLHWDEVHALLAPALPDNDEVKALLSSGLRPGRCAALLRGTIIESFIDAGVHAFMQHHDELLAGRVEGDLTTLCASPVREIVEGAKELAKRRVFEHPRKVELEIGAYQVIGTLLDHLVDAAMMHPVAAPTKRRVEVVVPVRDRPEALRRCVAALLESGVERVVVVDDGSRHPVSPELWTIPSKGSRKLSKAREVRVVRRDASGGPAAARTTGFAATTADLVAFVDSDVEVSDQWLAPLLGLFDDSRVGLVA